MPDQNLLDHTAATERLTQQRLDAHRKAAIARDERVTMTGMYNVVEKLRSGAALTPKERTIHARRRRPLPGGAEGRPGHPP